jgi:hypothetical protein
MQSPISSADDVYDSTRTGGHMDGDTLAKEVRRGQRERQSRETAIVTLWQATEILIWKIIEDCIRWETSYFILAIFLDSVFQLSNLGNVKARADT